jgi:hypothetical protein
MKNFTEKTNKLSTKIRNEMLESLARSEYGQSIREELVDLINNTSSVRNISKEIIEGDSNRLAIEVVARDNATFALEELYKKLIPIKDKVAGFKTHK